MAITGCTANAKGGNIPNGGKREMTMAQFREWLDQFDDDKDGRISGEELREVIRTSGKWFSSWRSKRGVKSADINGNGYIDAHEIQKLVPFAEKTLGFKIIAE